MPAGASAATVSVRGCVADTGSGISAPTISVDDGWLADGQAAILQDFEGRVNPYVGQPPSGLAPTGDPVSEPYCATWRTADGTLTPAQWLYCLDHDGIYGCGDNPMRRSGTLGGKTPLTDLQRARLAWVMTNVADDADREARRLTQQYVWCVTMDLPAGAPMPGPGTFPGKSCPDWTAIDPTLVLDPELTVAGPATASPAGADAVFIVTTNLADLRIATSGIDDYKICAGQPGVGLSGSRLHIPSGMSTVRLCAMRSQAGGGSLSVRPDGPTAATLGFWVSVTGDPDCQGFVQQGPADRLVASADASWTAGPTPPGPPGPPGPPTPPTPPVTPPVTPPSAPPAVTPLTTIAPSTGDMPPARITLTKRANRVRVRAGGRVAFLLRVVNRSGRTLHDVTVCDVLPREMTVVSSRGAVMRKGRPCWTIERLRTHRTLRLVVRVDADAGRGRITNVGVARAPGVRSVRASRTVRVVPVHRMRPGGVTG